MHILINKCDTFLTELQVGGRVCYPLLRVSHVNMRETQRVFPPSVPCLDGSQIDSLILFGVTRRLSPIR